MKLRTRWTRIVALGLLISAAAWGQMEIQSTANETVRIRLEPLSKTLDFVVVPPKGYEFVPQESRIKKWSGIMGKDVNESTKSRFEFAVYLSELSRRFSVRCGGVLRPIGGGPGKGKGELPTWNVLITNGPYLDLERDRSTLTWTDNTRTGPTSVTFRAFSDDSSRVSWEYEKLKGVDYRETQHIGFAQLKITVVNGTRKLVGSYAVEARDREIPNPERRYYTIVDVDLQIANSREASKSPDKRNDEEEPGVVFDHNKYYPVTMVVADGSLSASRDIAELRPFPAGSAKFFTRGKNGSYEEFHDPLRWELWQLPDDLYVQVSPTLAKIDLVYTAPWGEQFTDTVRQNVVDVDIIRVPKHLFASARYATPIRFRFDGRNADKIKLDHIDYIIAELYVNNGSKPVMSHLLLNQDGSLRCDAVDAKNGIFECYVPADAYAPIDLGPTHYTKNAVFRLHIRLKKNPTRLALAQSDIRDREAEIDKRFADVTIHALDIRPKTGAGFHQTAQGFFHDTKGKPRTEQVEWPELNIDPNWWSNEWELGRRWYIQDNVIRWFAPDGRLKNKLKSTYQNPSRPSPFDPPADLSPYDLSAFPFVDHHAALF